MSQPWKHLVIELTYKLFEAPMRERIQEELDRQGAQGWPIVLRPPPDLDQAPRLSDPRPSPL